MEKKLFIAAMNAVLRMHAAIDRLDKIGFDIDRGVAQKICADLGKTIEEISDAMELEKNSAGYNDVEWWVEGVIMGKPYSCTDWKGNKLTPKTPEELWELIRNNKDAEE